MKRFTVLVTTVLVTFTTVSADETQEGDQSIELAKKLANPIANMISVPIQANYDENIGPNEDGSQWRTNVQPVIPFSLSEEWNLITRTIVPIIDQQDVPIDGMGESGLGDVVASQFFSPKDPTAGGWIWGVGPVWQLPTASHGALGGERLGMGPTGVAVRQAGPWTCGVLANHVWSVEGSHDREDISATLLQPFFSYVTKTKTTLTLATETTYDWEAEEWSVPINFVVNQMFKLGKLPVQMAAGVRYWADSTDDGPEGWGARLQWTFLLPR